MKFLVLDAMRVLLSPLDDGWTTLSRHRRHACYDEMLRVIAPYSPTNSVVLWYDSKLLLDAPIDNYCHADAITEQYQQACDAKQFTALTFCGTLSELLAEYSGALLITPHKLYINWTRGVHPVMTSLYKLQENYIYNKMKEIKRYQVVIICVSYSNPHLLIKSRKRVSSPDELTPSCQVLDVLMTSASRTVWIEACHKRNLTVAVLRIISLRDDCNEMSATSTHSRVRGQEWEEEFRTPTFYL